MSKFGIHKSKEAIVVTHESKIKITHYSKVLTNNEGMTCRTICLQFGNTT
jgi:hypothetical protein